MNMQQIQHILLEQASIYIDDDFKTANQFTEIREHTEMWLDARNKLALDALDRCELVMLCEEEFDVELHNNLDQNLTTIGALVCTIWKALKNGEQQ